MPSTTIPSFDLDPFSDELLAEPYDYYRELRDAGPVVHLEKYGVMAISRFGDVRAALRDWRTFSSREGISFNDLNPAVKETVLCMEPPDHDESRSVMSSRLRLAEIRTSVPAADQMAEQMVADLLGRGAFDAVHDLAQPFVTGFVGDLLGLPRSVLDVFVEGSSAGFTTVGPVNQRTEDALPILGELFKAMQSLTKENVRPGSIGWDILDADERGEIPESMRTQLIYNFTGASFDTTINAMGSILWLFATNPDQWALLRDDPSLIPAAINEVMRYESPVQIWSRFCPEDVEVDGATIPAGTRVGIFIGSANRDDRHYAHPERFDIRRNPTDQLGFGHGIHLCVGAPLARLELTSVLTAMVERVRTIDLVGVPALRLNNSTRGFEHLRLAIS